MLLLINRVVNEHVEENLKERKEKQEKNVVENDDVN